MSIDKINQSQIKMRNNDAFVIPKPEIKKNISVEPENIPEEIDSVTVTPEELINLANETLENAKLKAADILTQSTIQAETEAKKILAAARDGAYDVTEKARQQGFEAGKLEALKQADIQKQKDTLEFKTLLHNVPGQLDSLVDELEQQIVDLCVQMSESIVGFVLDSSDEAYYAYVKSKLAVFKSENKVVVRLNPREYDKYFKDGSTGNINIIENEINEIVVKRDSGIEPGGLIIDCGGKAVNGGISTQIAAIKREFSNEVE